MAIKPYSDKSDISYTLGSFPSLELLEAKPDQAQQIILSSRYRAAAGMPDVRYLCENKRIPWKVDDNLIAKLSPKENCFMVGIFRKYEQPIQRGANHLVLFHPSNMGNLGTILRTALGFGYCNVVIIRPSADLFDPKTVRASMGALFRMRVSFFDRLEDYAAITDNGLFLFRLDGEMRVEQASRRTHGIPHSLIFGNESSGLPEETKRLGTGLVIPHRTDIDSLSLPVAVGIALYECTRGRMEGVH